MELAHMMQCMFARSLRFVSAIVMAGGDETMVWAYVDEAFIRKVKVGQLAQVRSEVYSHLQSGSL